MQGNYFVTTLFLFCSLFISNSIALSQESVKADHIEIETVFPETFSKDEEVLVGLHFKPEKDWHVYWKNPGDSGAAPKFNFEGSNAVVSPILWPAPVRLPVAHLVNLGYYGDIVYLFTVKPNHDKSVQLKINLEWLVCKEECIPGFAEIDVERSITDKVVWKSEKRKLIETYASRLPRDEVSQSAIQIASLTEDATSYSLKITAPADVDLQKLEIYPVNGEFVNPKKPVLDVEKSIFRFEKNKTANKLKTSDWVVTYENESWEFKNINVGLSAANVNLAEFALICFFALVGGLILNLMPCVFPVISIKAFSLLKSDSRERVKECISYSLGVLTTFTGLGLIFLLVRMSGAAVGWGFQLQYPPVIFGLIVLFWLLAFNFLGYFEFGHSVMNLAGKLSSKSSSFGVGVLSVFIAAPCTGPFMGAALGAVIALPPATAWLVFFFLGLGLALPFLFFALVPKSMSWLPKPGAWMETLKHFFAFPLLATVLWLLWILGQQTGIDGWFLSAKALFLLSFSLWIFRQKFKLARTAAWVLALISVGYVGFKFTGNFQTSDLNADQVWHAYDEVKIQDARSKGQAVFIDFTAAWCITCQVNKQAVLNTEKALKLFNEKNVYLVRADWTRYDPKITAALEKLGRNSVPVYAYYAADNSPVYLLPQILTLNMIEELK